MSKPAIPFPCGVIEGFYGRSWPHETRLAYSALLPRMGLNTYLYCPKNDPYLRSQWRLDWPKGGRSKLIEMGQACSKHGVDWGVGLSPVALYLDYGKQQRQALQERVLGLADLGLDVLAILFDDMPGDCPDLASRQADIITDVAAWLPHIRLMMCPTYYSFDPVLARYFGAMPDNYWTELGKALPADVHIFWTGNEVCSPSITERDIGAIVRLLGRPVTLWDNYPVNDGAARSDHLYLEPLAARDIGLAPSIGGHLCNPMNQGFASLPALNGLARLYGAGLEDAELAEIIGKSTWSSLQRDASEFLVLGLSGLGEARCAELARHYRSQSGEAAREVAEWLEGDYAFDPACLTD
jgi:hyaluronoglucosaminidase